MRQPRCYGCGIQQEPLVTYVYCGGDLAKVLCPACLQLEKQIPRCVRCDARDDLTEYKPDDLPKNLQASLFCPKCLDREKNLEAPSCMP